VKPLRRAYTVNTLTSTEAAMASDLKLTMKERDEPASSSKQQQL
jgi:hypothetical protein